MPLARHLKQWQSEDARDGGGGIVVFDFDPIIGQRVALATDFVKMAEAIRVASERTMGEGGDAALDQRQRTIEPHGNAVIGDKVEILLGQERAAAERHNARTAGLHGTDATVQSFGFDAAELGLAQIVEDGNDGGALFALNLFIEIQELPAELIREDASDRGFPASHEPHQVNAGRSL